MSKTEWKAGTMLYPLPVVLVSCGADDSEFNLFTVSWTGTIYRNVIRTELLKKTWLLLLI